MCHEAPPPAVWNVNRIDPELEVTWHLTPDDDAVLHSDIKSPSSQKNDYIHLTISKGGIMLRE